DALRIGNFSVLFDVLSHAVLPAIALGVLTAGVFLRLVRTNLIGTLEQQYIDSGRSRGISEYRLVTKHAYRPALIPIVTVMGMQIALMLAGAVLTETTFGWQGLGFKLAEYLTARDFVAVQGIVVFLAVIVAITNFIVDVLAAFIDPRVRYLIPLQRINIRPIPPPRRPPDPVPPPSPSTTGPSSPGSRGCRSSPICGSRSACSAACSSPGSCCARSCSSARSSPRSSPPTASTSSAPPKATSVRSCLPAAPISGAPRSAATMSSPASSGVPRPLWPSSSWPS